MNYLKDSLSNYKSDLNKFKLGMRTFKTSLVAFSALLIFHLFGQERLQIGTLTAIFSLRESSGKSVHFGFSRVTGNSVDGLLSLLFFFINQFFHNQFQITLILVPIFTMLGIMTNVSINSKTGVTGGTSALLITTLSIPAGDTILYVSTRILETFYGVFAVILVNFDVDKIKGLLRKRS